MATTSRKQEENKNIMNAASNTSHGLRDLFEVGLKDIYYAEKVMNTTLKKMVKNATSPELVSSLKNQIKETKEHVNRLEQIFEHNGIAAVGKRCEAMDGIVKETNGLMKETDMGVVRDAVIIAADQKAKHYEIATYGTLHAFAKTLGENQAANLLALNLDEDKKTDALLTGIAMASINRNAFKADALTNT